MSGSDDPLERACSALTELFSKPIKNAHSFRRYDLTFENGEPVFTLSEFDHLIVGLTRFLRKCLDQLPRIRSLEPQSGVAIRS